MPGNGRPSVLIARASSSVITSYSIHYTKLYDIDHDRVPRFPKRADFFARVLFGDMGKSVQEDGKNAHYVMKSPIGACARRALGALLLV